MGVSPLPFFSPDLPMFMCILLILKTLFFSISGFDILFVSYGYVREFVNCVRCIKILSPQEVQQMSLDGDFGNGGLPRQASSSSDGGIA